MSAALKHLAVTLVTRGRGAQVFLGARWIRTALRMTPASHRRSLALRLLALSPHYLYPDANGADSSLGRMARIQRESERVAASRSLIVEVLLREHLREGQIVVDFGCGPGFLARAVAPYAEEVVACDISAGALACADVLNPAPNIRYVQVSPEHPLPLDDESVDLVYSFAVIQHVSERQFEAILRDLFRILRPGGTVLCHIPVDKEAWRSEEHWRTDTSLRGRMKLKYGLNCFGRTSEAVVNAILRGGFSAPEVSRIGDIGDVGDADLSDQELFVFRRPGRRGDPHERPGNRVAAERVA